MIFLKLAWGKGLFKSGGKQFLYIFSDCFTIPGLLILCIGILLTLANTGIYDGFGYVISNTLRGLIPGGRSAKRVKYGDYVEKRKSKQHPSYAFLICTGLIDLALCVVSLFFYYNL